MPHLACLVSAEGMIDAIGRVRPSVRPQWHRQGARTSCEKKKTIFWHTTDFSLLSISKARRTKIGAPN